MITMKHFVPANNKVSICVVGTGGTGSHLLYRMAALNDNLIKLGYPGIELVAFDDDIVTKTNVGRQIFSYDSVNYPKVYAVIEDINEKYGFDWIGLYRKFSFKDAKELVNHKGFLISCVDNIETRKEIYHYYHNFSTYTAGNTSNFPYWIDVGNGDYFGQIIMAEFFSGNGNLPSIIDIFPKMEEYVNNSQNTGCSTRDATSKQSLFINDLMATFTVNMIKDFIINMQIHYSMLFFNLKTFEINIK